MHWIYLSPHLDDAVYSCGGLIWQQTRAGDTVEIWTVCAGDPPDEHFSAFAQELHQRWETPQAGVARRREEDRLACELVGAIPRYFPVPDCIYRRPGLDYWAHPGPNRNANENAVFYLYPDRESLFGPLHPLEADLPAQVAQRLAGQAPGGARLVSPLTLGGHVDHRLTRLAVETLAAESGLQPPWYYADYPYAADHIDEIHAILPAGWRPVTTPLEPAAVDVWAGAMAAHATQLSTFWNGMDDLRTRLAAYLQRLDGGVLWAPA